MPNPGNERSLKRVDVQGSYLVPRRDSGASCTGNLPCGHGGGWLDLGEPHELLQDDHQARCTG